MDVIGSDFRGPQEIGSAKFERESRVPGISWLNFWYPNKQKNDHRSIVYFKRTLTGLVGDQITKTVPPTKVPYGKPDGTIGYRIIHGEYSISSPPHIAPTSWEYPDHDLNIDVLPFVGYTFLIDDSHKPERSTEFKLKELVDSDLDPCTDPFIKVECEIDSSDSAKKSIRDSLLQRIGKQVAIYGPWIYDIGHCDHPEIHPAEQIWWTEYLPNKNAVYHLNLFCDSSERFWWRSQMDNGTKLHPWGAPPINGTFAIAFEVPIDQLRPAATVGKHYEVANVDYDNVATYPDTDKVYNLEYQNQTLVSFVPHNNAFKVSFEGVGLEPGIANKVHGFLVLETSVGTVKQIATNVPIKVGDQTINVAVPQGSDPDKVDQRLERAAFQKVAGHYLFTVTRSDVAQTPVMK